MAQEISVDTFKGNEEKMNGHVFKTFNKCEDATKFQKTLDALKEYANKTMKYALDIRQLFKTLKRPEIKEPDITVKRATLRRAEMIKVKTKQNS